MKTEEEKEIQIAIAKAMGIIVQRRCKKHPK